MKARVGNAFFARLGSEIERRWLEAGRDEEALPAVAAEAVEALPIADHFDREAFLDAELDPAVPARRERAPLGAFGQPGLTVYWGRGFVIEVYFWVDAIAGIHNHPFRGLFAILEGFSVHATFDFEAHDTAGELRLGALAPSTIEVVEAGAHRLFSAERHALIHTLIHVPVPSLSMVVRTLRSEGYFRYYPPSLAVAAVEPDRLVAQQLALLESLRQCGDPSFLPRLTRYLAASDLTTAWHALSPIWVIADEGARGALLDAVSRLHAPKRVEALAAALAREVRTQQADALRRQLRDPDDRFVATALVCGHDRARVLSVLGARHEDPLGRLHQFIDAHPSFFFDHEESTAAAHILVDGGGVEGLLAEVAAKQGAAVAEGRRAQLERFCTESSFAALAG